MRTKASVMVLGLVCSMFMTTHASAAVTNRHKVTSQLFGSNTMNARSVYEQCLMDGTPCKKFSVVVDHAAPNRSYSIYLNGSKVGSVSTNSTGAGKMSMRTAAFIGATNAHPIPSGFPSVGMGDFIKVGSRMAGIFFERTDSDVQDSEVEGALGGVEGASGDVSYKEEFDDGALDREFDLQFEGAAPGEVLDITVNGVVVFTVTADADGAVDLVLKSASSNEEDDQDGQCDDDNQGDDDQGGDDGGSSQIIPDSFPSIHAGDVVGIGFASATMGSDDNGDDDGQNGDDGDDDDGGDDGGDD